MFRSSARRLQRLLGTRLWRQKAAVIPAFKFCKTFEVHRLIQTRKSLAIPKTADFGCVAAPSPPKVAKNNLSSFSRKTIPFSPRAKFAAPPDTRILPRSLPCEFPACSELAWRRTSNGLLHHERSGIPNALLLHLQILTPSPHPAYTLPALSVLIPSGIPTEGIANVRLFDNKGPAPEVTS